MKERTKDLLIYVAMFVAGAVIAALLLGALGCVTTEHPDGTSETTLAGLPIWHADETGTVVPSEGLTSALPWWGEVLAGVGLGFLFPRTRKNLIGAGKAIADVDLADAGKHVAALTGLTHTPPNAPPKKHS